MSGIHLPFAPGSRFYLPEFPYFLPARCHPEAEWICRESNSWVRENMGFAMANEAELYNLIEEGAALWTCYVLPTSDTDRLVHLCNYTEYLSVFDNAMVDPAKIGKDPVAAKELFGRVVTILNDTAVGADFEWGRELQGIWRNLRADFSEPHWARFMAEVQRFLSGCVAEITSRNDDMIFDYESYIRVRRDSVGMGMYFVLGEYGIGVDLTDELARSQELRDIIAIALDHIMLTNDMFSFRAECSVNDYVNALAVLRLSNHLSLQEAVDELFAVIERKRTDFMAARRAIENSQLGASPAVRSYLDALWHMMAGNLQWSYLTSRYNGIGHQWNGVTHGVVTLYPDHTVFSGDPYWTLSRTESRAESRAVAARPA